MSTSSKLRRMLGWASTVAAAAALSAAIMIGCEKQSGSAPQAEAQAPAASPAPASAQPRAAVVDLDAVAKAIGADTVIASRIKEAVEQLNEQLINAAMQMEEQLKEEQTKLAADAPQEERVRLARMVQAARQQVQSNKAVAQMRAQQVRAQLIVSFRQQIRPHAANVARANNANLVLLPSDTVLWFDASVDITDELIAELRAKDVKVQVARPETLPADDSTPSTPAPSNP